jgi:hypothetical protein
MHWRSSAWGRMRAQLLQGRRSGEGAAACRKEKLGVGADERPGERIGTRGAAAMAEPP